MSSTNRYSMTIGEFESLVVPTFGDGMNEPEDLINWIQTYMGRTWSIKKRYVETGSRVYNAELYIEPLTFYCYVTTEFRKKFLLSHAHTKIPKYHVTFSNMDGDIWRVGLELITKLCDKMIDEELMSDVLLL